MRIRIKADDFQGVSTLVFRKVENVIIKILNQQIKSAINKIEIG